jgi:ABC-type Fe3+ transport system permease subunit
MTLVGFAIAFVGVPVGSLVWRAGLSGTPLAWSVAEFQRNLRLAVHSSIGVIDTSLLVAAVAGAVAASLALLACWVASDSASIRAALFVLVAVAWATPGPVIGLGLKAAIEVLLDGTHSETLEVLLWRGPSFAPVVWVNVVRFFPCAVAILWPALRLLPVELREAAKVEGAGPLRELAAVVVPLLAGTWLLAALATGVLALGEVSAGKLVSTAGGETWTHHVFTQMHYGVTSSLAAQCLLLLIAIAAGVGVVGVLLNVRPLTRRFRRTRDNNVTLPTR